MLKGHRALTLIHLRQITAGLRESHCGQAVTHFGRRTHKLVLGIKVVGSKLNIGGAVKQ
ncbi:hypothetical protein D9M69_611640 [compost metagenome]